MSFIFGGLHVGSLLGLFVAPPLIERFGWPTVFYAFGLLGEYSFLTAKAEMCWLPQKADCGLCLCLQILQSFCHIPALALAATDLSGALH